VSLKTTTSTGEPVLRKSAPAPRTRMSGDERRQQILEAAIRVFAKGGFAGTTTDQVAREAGVSQPYVIRSFGTKLELFVQVMDYAMTRIREAFEAEIAAAPFDPENDDDWLRLGMVYTELMVDRDLLMVMMHGILAGDNDEMGAEGRRHMAAVYRTLAATGADDERITDFIAHGMLLNVMLAIRAPEHVADDAALAPLTTCAFGDALAFLHPASA
jgi:AcrR family transcriptional regulator